MNHLQLSKIIDINSPILITGASGTGKSQLAHKIFNRSLINRDCFLVLHLASIKEDLIESELFGHKKGSFTGALENKLGYFQEVGKGTLFLDEIGELSIGAQKKLLWVLEEKKFTPIGSTQAIDFKGRVIIATNKNLEVMVKNGTFREDLFFRLNVFKIELESISKNKEKLQKELNILFENIKKKYQKFHLELGDDLEKLMLNAEWKGNYRELKNCLEYMVVMSDGGKIKIEDFPAWFLKDSKPNQAKTETDFITHFPKDYRLAIENFEKWYLEAMLMSFKGKVNETARILGMSKATLINKTKKYQINTLQIRAKMYRTKPEPPFLNLAKIAEIS